jgi:hypothetical protein
MPRVLTLSFMRGIPEKYVKEITTLVWGFIWGGGINQIDRKVCCLGVENGGMGMINIQEFIDSKRIKLFLKVIEELQNILVFRMESMSLLHN